MHEITYKLTRDELRAYHRAARDRMQRATPYRWWERPTVRWFALAAASFVFVLVVDRTISAAFGRPMEFLEFLLGVLLGVVAMSATLWVFYHDQVRRMTRQDGPILGEHTLRGTSEGLTISAAGVETRYAWPVIEEITEDRDLLLLWIEPGVAIAIPPSAFTSPAKRFEFRQRLEALKASSGLPRFGPFA